MLEPNRRFDGTASVARPPAIGDVAAVWHEYDPGDLAAPVIVEMVDKDGRTIWLADFERSELKLVSEDAGR